MKTIGLLGGMSWESTALYYKLINEKIKQKLGGLHSAKIMLSSVDFEEIEELQHAGEWDSSAVILSEAAKSVEAAGADFLLLCTNTMHKVADKIEKSIKIPFIHIADATAEAIAVQNIKRVGLLGTRFTMDDSFYKNVLSVKHDLEVLVPSATEQTVIHQVIYDELCQGKINAQSRQKLLEIMKALVAKGAEGIILGCTEIALLVQAHDIEIPLFDTTEIHAEKAVKLALL